MTGSLPESLTIRTGRLVLRPVAEGDAERTARLITKDVADNLSTWPFPMTVDQVFVKVRNARSALEQRTAVDWAIVVKDRRELAGWIGLHKSDSDSARLGYWLGSGFRGRGIMYEAASEAIRVACAFLGIRQVIAGVLPANLPSIALLKRLGFEASGEETIHLQTSGRTETILRFEWPPRDAAQRRNAN